MKKINKKIENLEKAIQEKEHIATSKFLKGTITPEEYNHIMIDIRNELDRLLST